MTTLLLILNLMTMTHELPKLPYALDALTPQISEETMLYHYRKHHKAYVDNLNRLIEGTPWQNASLEEIVRGADGAIFNNAAQTWNHTFFFLSLSPDPKSVPTGPLAEAIHRDFGSFDALKEALAKAAAGQFGSGWAWLVKGKKGELSVVAESNAGNPMTRGLTPLLNIDVWEHAYYIDYRNRRPDFIQALWDRVDWKAVEKRFEEQ